MKNFAIVIPAYNEEKTIYNVANRALEQSDIVIVVDDGSVDKTNEITRNLPVTLVTHATNKGKAASLWDGMQAALMQNADYVVTLDADGQHAPEDIPRLASALEKQPESIIIGSRLADKESIPRKRYYANKVANFWISWAAGYPIDDSQSGFRIYPANLLKQLTIATDKSKSFVFESEILIKAARLGFNSTAVPIAAIYADDARPSHFRGVTDIALITRMVAWKLISRAFYPRGLYHGVIRPLLPIKKLHHIGADGFTMLLLSSFLIIITGGLSLLRPLWRIYRTAKYTSSDVAEHGLRLVLGVHLKNDKPTKSYLQRLERAYHSLQQSPQEKILILGGVTGNAKISEAKAGKSYLLEHGVNASQIVTEEKSQNTLENMKQAKSLLKQQIDPAVIITNRHHLERSHTQASGFGIQHSLCAAEDRLELNIKTLLSIVKESFHLHWYLTGKYWAIWTKNQKMLDRIT